MTDRKMMTAIPDARAIWLSRFTSPFVILTP
jgi:hypothetical protein